jgi:predicted transcriptional regulator of viral defense system
MECKEMARALGELESRALAYCQFRERWVVETGALIRDLKWTPQQESKVLSKLARKGLIARVRRGLYLVPGRLPIGGRWSPGEILALTTIIEDRGGAYQISGPNAFQRYGWTKQISNRVYAYNNRISGDRQIGSVALTLIKVSDDRLGGTEVVQTPTGLKAVYATRARALVDAVYDWSRFDTLPRAYQWIEQEVARDHRFVADLVHTTTRFGNQGTLRRIGATLERLAAPEPLLRRLERALRPTSSFIPLAPYASKRGKPEHGKTSKRWAVVFNHE